MPRKVLTTIASFFVTAFLTSNVVFAGITPPTTTIVQTPSSPDGNSGWYVSPVQFDLSSTDLNSGVHYIHYRVDQGSWQSVEFQDTLNLAPNPSFDTAGLTTSGLASWEATLVDVDTVYSQDLLDNAPSYAPAAAKITSTTLTPGLWHGINNRTVFGVAGAYENMTASLYMKTENVVETAYFKIYSIADDGLGGEVITLLGVSPTLTGTAGWSKLSLDFTVLPELATGIYIDIGLEGTGTIWADAVVLNSSLQVSQTSVIVGSDNEAHTFEYYAEDTAGNMEAHSCAGPLVNCIEFKMDLTPPGNWYGSGALRGFFGSSHELYVYTNVQDATSGLSVFTDKYQYKTETQTGFGRYSWLLSCNSTWRPDDWTILITPPFSPGANSAFLLTPKTDFCNSNWKICKTVRFFAEDLAGNSVTKDFCINGPWIRLRGEGVVRSNQNIDMLSEPEGDNTDGLIESSGASIDFFTTSTDWELTNVATSSPKSYADWWALTSNQTEIATNEDLISNDGTYHIGGNYEIDNQSLPNDYDNNTFKQVVFVDGDLTISRDITTASNTAALFIVSGNVNIAKNVDEIQIGIFSDGIFDTAYDVGEGESNNTLVLNGLFSADQFLFKRTLQGTNNDDDPSEDFIYEPKFLIKLKDFFGKHTITWRNVE
ncbi:hypothetical protein HN803_08200 [candidate division WWE3 bacterium]|jgi:hypothetical protein|nr:hypothetical protein [candidate division WWE3 bacterium]MBT7350732.1 hypothetical protein [candidate division WWE3 bacterium]